MPRVIPYAQQREYRRLREAAGATKVVVDMEALRSAYGSQAYSVYRTEVEQLRAHLLTNAKIKSKDLICPFPLHGESAEQQMRIQNAIRKAAYRQEVLRDSLTAADKKLIAAGEMSMPVFLPPPDAATLIGRDLPPKIPAEGPARAAQTAAGPKRQRRPAPSSGDAARSWGS